MLIPGVQQMKQALRRVRRRRSAGEQKVLDGLMPLAHHDLLVVPPANVISTEEIFRVPVVKLDEPANQGEQDQEGGTEGTYVDMPEKLDLYDYAQRRTMAIARPQEWGPKEHRDTARGPAFGTLPVKREPAATSCAACYLINAQNINFRNAWTAEEWSDFGTVDLPPAPAADDERFEVLLAGPRGKVFQLVVNIADGPKDLWTLGQKVTIGAGDNLGTIQSVDLRYEMETWNHLRNGCVVGRVLSHRSNKCIPLVNITSLTSDEAPSSTTTASMAPMGQLQAGE